MNLSVILKLPISSNSGWPDLLKAHPSLTKLFASTLLPLALLPPVLLYLTGTDNPGLFPQQLANKSWGEVATAFFILEIATSLTMGWGIKTVAGANDLCIDQRDAFLVTAIAPVPMWLSSLGLLLPSMLYSLLIMTVGFGLTCRIIYNGVLAICRTSDELIVASIVQTVVAVGLVAWALLFAWAIT